MKIPPMCRMVLKPKRGSTVSQGLLLLNNAWPTYDGGEDIYICPNGQRLAPYGKRNCDDIFFANYANRVACK